MTIEQLLQGLHSKAQLTATQQKAAETMPRNKKNS